MFNFILQLTIKIILKKERKKVSRDKKIRKSILGCSQNVVKHLEIKCSQTQKSGLRKSRKPHIYYSLVRLAGVKQKNSLSTAFIAPRILSWGTYGAVQLNIMHKNKAYVVICPVSLTFI